MLLRFCSLILVLLLVPTAFAHAATVVAPNGFDSVEGNEGNSFPFNNFTGRYQQAYGASQFAASPISISQIAFRTDTDPAAADWSSLLSFSIRMSTSANTVGNLSTTFANNIGGDDTLVFSASSQNFSGTNAGGTGPNAFDLVLTLDTPFNYDPTNGDLLMEVLMSTNTNLTPVGGFSYLDAVESTTGLFDVGVQRVFNSSGNTSSTVGNADLHGAGLVTRFTYTVVPEPGTGLLVSLGLFGLASRRRRAATVALATLAVAAGSAGAAPIDQWNDPVIGPGFDCTSDPYNPIRADGTRDPHGDPLPGEPEWDARDAEHVACTDQRDHDSRPNPLRNVGTTQYGFDEYRDPARHDGIRFRHETFTSLDIPSVPSSEIFRPCPKDPTVCPNLPAGLERFDPPYPVVVVFHGIIAQKEHHRYTTQALAEEGYMAIGVSGTLPAGGAPNVQRTQNGDDVLRWLNGETNDPGIYGIEADLHRVAFAGHSQGAGASFSYQGDPRVHAIIAWDGGDNFSSDNCADDPTTGKRVACAPIMYQRTDGDFQSPRTDRDDYPYEDDSPIVFGGPRWRGQAPYDAHVARGMDVFHMTARATVHTDWNGYGVGLAGNRYGELLFNYHNLAWVDRHLRGKLVFDASGNVKTDEGRTEAEERVFRQAIANDAFERLTARFFDDSADRHNISMGFWDPDLALASPTDPYAGNVPFQVEGLEIRDRHSPYYFGYCSVSVPDYVNGGSGVPDDLVSPSRVAETGPSGDLRYKGCPEL